MRPLPYWVDVQADLSLCWLHKSYCRFCLVLDHMFLWRQQLSGQSDLSFGGVYMYIQFKGS